jgi:hypothetical protein
MRSASRVSSILILAVLAVACGKAPAEQALKAADAAIQAARPEVEKYVPREWQSLSDAAATAKAQFEKGQYKEALAAAQSLMPQVQAALAAVEAKKKELATTFESLKGSLPGMLDALGTQLAAYAKMRRLPSGIDKGAVAAAQAELPNLTQAWSDAAAAFDGGDLMRAVEGGLSVKGKLEELRTTFMPSPGAAPAK